jgi:hypothetical protein
LASAVKLSEDEQHETCVIFDGTETDVKTGKLTPDETAQ